MKTKHHSGNGIQTTGLNEDGRPIIYKIKKQAIKRNYIFNYTVMIMTTMMMTSLICLSSYTRIMSVRNFTNYRLSSGRGKSPKFIIKLRCPYEVISYPIYYK
jgi:hypothetical protein